MILLEWCMARSTIARQAPGLFDIDNCLAELSAMGDCLNRLDSMIDWKIFVELIEPHFGSANNTAVGGRPAYPVEVMFKLLTIQRLNNLSDAQTEFQACDRLTHRRFLGLSLADAIPDQNTIREFREKLVKADLFAQLFEIFNRQLLQKGLLPKEGSVIDATFVEVPRQRNSREENRQIKGGATPEPWTQKPEKLAQKDVDARWTKKNQEAYYGYKDHLKINVRSKLIEAAVVTSAEVHDSQAVGQLVEKGDVMIFADSAYSGKPVAEEMASVGVSPAIVGKARQGRELTGLQRKYNRAVSRVRARGEHVFGAMTGDAGRLFQRHIGYARNRSAIIMLNLVYNLRRYEQIVRLDLMPI